MATRMLAMQTDERPSTPNARNKRCKERGEGRAGKSVMEIASEILMRNCYSGLKQAINGGVLK